MSPTKAAAFLYVALAGLATAAPTAVSVGISVEVWDADSNPVDFLNLLEPGQIAAGSSANFNPVDSDYASAINVDYQVVTSGQSRTVTITYTALGDQFVETAAFGAMQPLPDDGLYAMFFDLFLTDSDWDGVIASRSSTAKLFADGQLMVDGGSFSSPSPSLGSGGHGFVDLFSPAEPGFFGSPLVADQFVYELTYRIVPAPGALAAAALLGLTTARRRRN